MDAVIEAIRASGVELGALVSPVLSTLGPQFYIEHKANTSNQSKALSLPKEHEMPARDKYTTFSRTDKGYRKSLHKVPKWTRLTIRENPRGF